MILIAFACTFISILARQPTVTFSPVAVIVPVRKAKINEVEKMNMMNEGNEKIMK